MRKLIIVIIALVLLFVGYRFYTKPQQIPRLSQDDYFYTIRFGGLDRTWIAHVPLSYLKDRPTAMIINFHGGGGDAPSARKESQMDLTSDKDGFIVVYPNATGKTIAGKLLGMWNVGKLEGKNADNNPTVDDVGFIRALIADMSQKFNIDQKRIYATGLSRGGMMSYKVACDLADKIAAIAPISTAYVQGSYCQPSRPISVIQFHGTKDRAIPYNGGKADSSLPSWAIDGASYISFQESADTFLKFNSCKDNHLQIYSKGDTSCVLYPSCSETTAIELCTSQDAGHTWPGGQYDLDQKWWISLVGGIATGISANDEMWNFFQQHPLP